MAVRNLKDFRRAPEPFRKRCDEKCPIRWPMKGPEWCDHCGHLRSPQDFDRFPPVGGVQRVRQARAGELEPPAWLDEAPPVKMDAPPDEEF